ncbi:MAG TPA: gluconeogenesis factor YvcK family protein [Abditibacteriaceae bacterium]
MSDLSVEAPRENSPREEALRLLKQPLGKSPRDWRSIKWLTIGLGIKRWGLMALLGLLLAVAGALLAGTELSLNIGLAIIEWVVVLTGRVVDPVALGIALVIAGAAFVIIGLNGTLNAVQNALGHEDFLEAAFRRRKLEHGEHVVALGGGTGLSTMLRGLKKYTSNITAVVTMADDGGSSGQLRKEGMLPPGDLRNCMAALADAEPQMTALFQHRFEGMGPLKGHSLGNLVVAAMCEITGDFESAVQETARVLSIRGKVLPSTLEDVRLSAELENGEEIHGQSKVNKQSGIERVFLTPESPKALPGVVEAIASADVILIGPGSLFTSIIPNLLVPEIAAAIKASRAPKIYICNVMTQPGETHGYTAADHVRAIVRHAGKEVIDYVLLNDGVITEASRERYARAGATPVVPDDAAIEMLDVKVLRGNFVFADNVVRHDADKLAASVFRVLEKM